MKKFSKIFETKEKILDVIGIEESDIKDICQDLIDEYDFTFKITPQWISKSGSIYYKANQASETYPSLLVSLTRDITDQTGETKNKKDPRIWNGGVYYEDDADLIKVVYETIRRLESMLDKGEIKVFYSIRSMDDIQLRITTPIEQTKLPIDVENVVNFIENRLESRAIQEQLPYTEYKIEATSYGNQRSVEIVPTDTRFHNDVSQFRNDLPCDVILKRAILNKQGNPIDELDNGLDLYEIANFIIEKLRDACTKGDAKRSDIVADLYENSYGLGNGTETFIKYNKIPLIKITAIAEKIGNSKKIRTSKGLFKDSFVDVNLYKMELKIDTIGFLLGL